MKKIAVVPTLLTLGNGICGFVAITYASKINAHETPAFIDHCFGMAGWFILIAMVFDMLDGYVARLSKTASNFGGELDSLCDVVSFGVTPAFLLLKMGPGWDAHFLHQLLAGFLLVMLNELAPLLVFWGYAFLFPLRALWVRSLRPDAPAPQVEEQPPH